MQGKGFFSSGIEAVDQVGQMNITGNIIPAIWRKTILTDKGKPYYLAMEILAEIVYWYRPTEIRDEITGQVLGWKKKFHGDMLQRSYSQLEKLYDVDANTIKRALQKLEEIGVANRVFRDIRIQDGTILYKVMFLNLNVDALYELTYPNNLEKMTIVNSVYYDDYQILDERSADEVNNKKDFSDREKLSGGVRSNLSGGSDQIWTEGPIKFEHTYTENNTKNNTENNTEIKSIYQSSLPEVKEMDGLMEHTPEQSINQDAETDVFSTILKNTQYEQLIASNDVELVDKIFGYIHDAIEQKQPIVVGKQEISFSQLIERFTMLNDKMIVSVIDNYKPKRSEIKYPKKYILSMLYNAKDNDYAEPSSSEKSNNKHGNVAEKKSDFEQHTYTDDYFKSLISNKPPIKQSG